MMIMYLRLTLCYWFLSILPRTDADTFQYACKPNGDISAINIDASSYQSAISLNTEGLCTTKMVNNFKVLKITNCPQGSKSGTVSVIFSKHKLNALFIGGRDTVVKRANCSLTTKRIQSLVEVDFQVRGIFRQPFGFSAGFYKREPTLDVTLFDVSGEPGYNVFTLSYPVGVVIKGPPESDILPEVCTAYTSKYQDKGLSKALLRNGCSLSSRLMFNFTKGEVDWFNRKGRQLAMLDDVIVDKREVEVEQSPTPPTIFTHTYAFRFYLSNYVRIHCDVRICPQGSVDCILPCDTVKGTRTLVPVTLDPKQAKYHKTDTDEIKTTERTSTLKPEREGYNESDRADYETTKSTVTIESKEDIEFGVDDAETTESATSLDSEEDDTDNEADLKTIESTTASLEQKLEGNSNTIADDIIPELTTTLVPGSYDKDELEQEKVSDDDQGVIETTGMETGSGEYIDTTDLETIFELDVDNESHEDITEPRKSTVTLRPEPSEDNRDDSNAINKTQPAPTLELEPGGENKNFIDIIDISNSTATLSRETKTDSMIIEGDIEITELVATLGPEQEQYEARSEEAIETTKSKASLELELEDNKENDDYGVETTDALSDIESGSGEYIATIESAAIFNTAQPDDSESDVGDIETNGSTLTAKPQLEIIENDKDDIETNESTETAKPQLIEVIENDKDDIKTNELPDTLKANLEEENDEHVIGTYEGKSGEQTLTDYASPAESLPRKRRKRSVPSLENLINNRKRRTTFH